MEQETEQNPEREETVEIDNEAQPSEEKMLVEGTERPTEPISQVDTSLTPATPEDDFDLPNWDEIEGKTHELSMELCEQLRLVLEPTKATKMRGDYRTGKRLNLRKIPAYIASHYRRDKIWLRRTKPSTREYQITLSVDNSRSMRGGAGRLAVEALAMTATALSRLEAGTISVTSFGESANCLHPATAPWNTDAGRALLTNLTFKDDSTDVASLLALINEGGGGSEWQLHVILSDGICHDHANLAQLINAGLQRRIIHVFVILDPTVSEISHVEYRAEGIKMTKYLETFPFQFYVVLRDIHALPLVLADAIRQWFETVSLLD
ncbi:putative midasin [Paramicrosporidium saccamoebae]|uniref:Putative midasin n=1 Tax=Paramicrosporidium saccamoebae TaxID=1246581 RepID=A0A2H9TMN7_9FUNG|nr:putative midasin [Paramicrosporidium saccamoebae]